MIEKKKTSIEKQYLFNGNTTTGKISFYINVKLILLSIFCKYCYLL